MAQILTMASLVALLGWLGWHRRPSEPVRHAQVERRVYKAPANEFLRGAADLTFGFVILGLGFFMLMWVIATA
jgi:hypothetical protein